MAFIKRAIDVEFTLATGTFQASQGNNTLRFSGLRVSAHVVTVGSVGTQGTLALQVWGLPLSVINQLTTIGVIATERRFNTVKVYAGDQDSKLSLVYAGQIDTAYGDMSALPDAVFNVTALSSIFAAVTPVPAVSYSGTVNAEDVLSSMAQTAGLAFTNYGVTAPLNRPYFAGSLYDQIKSCLNQAGCEYRIDRGVLSIWPSGTGITPDSEILISPEKGMRGYPSFSSQGIEVETLFNPMIQVGATVTVESSLPLASGKWTANVVSHQLQSEMPNGEWFTYMQGAHNGL